MSTPDASPPGTSCHPQDFQGRTIQTVKDGGECGEDLLLVFPSKLVEPGRVFFLWDGTSGRATVQVAAAAVQVQIPFEKRYDTTSADGQVSGKGILQGKGFDEGGAHHQQGEIHRR